MVLLSVQKLPLANMCLAAFKLVAQYFCDPAFSLFHILTYPLCDKMLPEFFICLSPPQFQPMTSCFQISHYLKLLIDINTFLSGSSSALWGPPSCPLSQGTAHVRSVFLHNSFPQTLDNQNCFLPYFPTPNSLPIKSSEQQTTQEISPFYGNPWPLNYIKKEKR